MSRKDAVMKATAGALQPQGFDLAQLRQRSMADGPALKMKPETAAGAFAFAAQDWDDDGETVVGNPLTGIMLRIKFANQRSAEMLIKGAHALLRFHFNRETERDPGRARRTPPAIFNALALVAIFEWCHDACPKCRDKHPRPIQAEPCDLCQREDKEGRGLKGNVREDLIGGKWVRFRSVAARPGCPKCKGMGRIFVGARSERRGKGVVCAACGNRGRRYFDVKTRWKLVNEARGEGVAWLDFGVFRDRWNGRYIQLLRTLRAIDKKIAQTVDIQISRSHNSRIELGPVEEPAQDERGVEAANDGATRMSPR